MTTFNRSALINKFLKVLRKHYQPVKPNVQRSVLEQLLFAACLENSAYEAAEEAFAKLQESFFDWNEVRVTTVRELAEEMPGLHDPAGAAERVRSVLQSVFDSQYSFDLEGLRKQNLGKAMKILEGYRGATPFMAAYVVQVALGGHTIPVNRGVVEACWVLNLVNDKQKAAGTVSGLERAIPKSKGLESASLLHQFGAQLLASPYSPDVHKVLLEVDAGCKERLPKRSRARKKEPQDEGPAGGARTAKKQPRRGTKKAAPAVARSAKKKSAPDGAQRRKPR